MNAVPSPPPSTRAQLLYDEFRAGLTACLRSWSALRAAVEGGWGGHESLAKAEDLRRNILQHLDGSSFPPRSITIDDLEDNLAIYLEEEFCVMLEDNSERQVADSIWRMYEECMVKGDATLARQLVQAANGVLQQSTAFPVKVQSQEEDDDDADDDMEMDDDAIDQGMSDDVAPPLVAMPIPPMTNPAEYAAQNLFGPPSKPAAARNHPEKPVRQLGEAEAAPEPAVPVDEDGFAPVVKRKGRRN